MDFKRKIKQLSAFILTALVFVVCLTGCRNSKKELAEKFSAYLKQTYHKEFVVESVTANEYWYEAICYPADDSTMRFNVECDKRGSISQDYYVGAIVAKEEEEFFLESMGDGLGESIVRCEPLFFLNSFNRELLDCVRNGTLDAQTAYQYHKVYDWMNFTIYLNADACDEDYGKEFDSIEKAVNDMVAKYHDLYGVDLEVDIHGYLLDSVTYQSVKDYYENPSKELELFYILVDAHGFYMEMGNIGETRTAGIIYNRDQYIAYREGIVDYWRYGDD